MVYINEWLPNPTGNDNCKTNCGWNIEFVELVNMGDSAVSLNGWALWTGGKAKKIFLNGRIGAGGYFVIKKGEAKISLKNNDGGLWLYGSNGAVVDEAAFVGAAPIAKSFSRVDYGSEDTQHFAFVDPTPGAKNEMIDTAVAANHFLPGTPLEPLPGAFQFLSLLIGFVAVLGAATAHIIHNNEDISQFISGANAGAR